MTFDPRRLMPPTLRPYVMTQEAGEAYIAVAAVFSLVLVVSSVTSWASEWWWQVASLVLGGVVGYTSGRRITKRALERKRR